MTLIIIPINIPHNEQLIIIPINTPHNNNNNNTN